MATSFSPSNPEAPVKDRDAVRKERVMDVVVFALLGFTASNALGKVVNLAIKRIQNSKWHLWIYMIWFAVVVTILTTLVIVTVDDDPMNDAW